MNGITLHGKSVSGSNQALKFVKHFSRIVNFFEKIGHRTLFMHETDEM